MISLYRANKYGVAYSLDEDNRSIDHFYTSTKWLLARWYTHGASFVSITTFLSKTYKPLLLILGKEISFLPQKFDLYSIINFSPVRVKQLFILYMSNLLNFKSFKSV